MKIFKKIFALLIIIAVIVSDNVWVKAADEKEDINRKVSLKEAERVAVSHIQGVMAMDSESDWNNGVRIKVRKALFDLDEEIAAYYFGLVNKNEEAGGYVIVSADTSGVPILEYSQEGKSFIDISIQKTGEKAAAEYGSNVKNGYSKVLYLGNMTYYIKHVLESDECVMYDSTTSNSLNADKKELKDKNKKDKRNSYNDLWENYSFSQNDKQSNPPDSGNDFITNPVMYESNYNDYEYYVITKGDTYYNIMDDFSSGNVCSPTAATNLCKYWYVRDTTKYINLFKDASWDSVFWSFYEYMDTDVNSGTSHDEFVDAYTMYFNEVGLSCSAYHSTWTNNGEFVVGELRNDRPCHLSLLGHYKYGNHSVLAIGYSRYIYNGGKNSLYIKIADGWTNYANRYVWAGTTSDWCMTTVVPK